MIMETLIAASRNKGKVKELKALLGHIYDVKSLDDIGLLVDVEETGQTFEENALLKAREIHRLVNKPVLSDDSGLEVDALGGEPGVYSARYSAHGDDDANIDKLLLNMRNIKNRTARFVSAIAMIDGKGREITARGETEGEILRERQGRGGFGYDPVFFSADLKKSFGEASDAEKNAVSHRFRALKNLLSKI